MKVLEFETANPGQDNIAGDEEVPEERKRAIQEGKDIDTGTSSGQDQRSRSHEGHRVSSRSNEHRDESRYYPNPSHNVQPRPADRGPRLDSRDSRHQT
jgi:hypothetical protein